MAELLRGVLSEDAPVGTETDGRYSTESAARGLADAYHAVLRSPTAPEHSLAAAKS
jgi:hypothetical protein